jgi:hypothetical protein
MAGERSRGFEGVPMEGKSPIPVAPAPGARLILAFGSLAVLMGSGLAAPVAAAYLETGG